MVFLENLFRLAIAILVLNRFIIQLFLLDFILLLAQTELQLFQLLAPSNFLEVSTPGLTCLYLTFIKGVFALFCRVEGTTSQFTHIPGSLVHDNVYFFGEGEDGSGVRPPDGSELRKLRLKLFLLSSV